MTLDELSRNRLPERIVEVINNSEITIAELGEYERGKPSFNLDISSNGLELDVRVRLPFSRKNVALICCFGMLFAITVTTVIARPDILLEWFALLRP